MRALAGWLLIAWLQAPGFAEDRPRFSSGLIHSAAVEIELEIEGATRLSLDFLGNLGVVHWGDVRFIDANDKITMLKEIRAMKPRKSYWSLDLSKHGFVRLTAELQVKAAPQELVRIVIDHDAPRAEAKPSTKSIAALQGDAARGRNVFFGRGTCASCHVVEGRGARVGRLSHLGKRSKREEIIESITTPDTVLAEGFETNIVQTKDGTPHLGFVVADSKERVTIKDSAAQLHKIDKKDVAVRKPQSFSLMPPFGEILSRQQIADLAAFLGTSRDD